MSVNKDLRWLRSSELTGPAKRFADFVATDVKQQSKTNPDFDFDSYNEVAKIITKKLQTPYSEDDRKDEH